MAKMNLSSSRGNVRRLAKLYGMPECAVREMLAIERGDSDGDVKTVAPGPAAPSFFPRIGAGLWVLFGTLFQIFHRSHR